MCIANSKIVADHAKRFAHGHWSFLWPGSEKKWYGTHTHTYKPNGEWDRVAEVMMLNFSETGHPVFRASSALQRGDLKSKRKGHLSVHFCVDIKGLREFSGAYVSLEGDAHIGCDRVSQMTVTLGIREEAGRRTVSPRPSNIYDCDPSRNESVSSMLCDECRDR